MSSRPWSLRRARTTGHAHPSPRLLFPNRDVSHLAELPITANTTFILKPFLEVPEAPTPSPRTHDVTRGDTVVVTETGAERLGTRWRELTVVDGA
ncbi:hypothetical protein [Streptomyces sp. NBC_01716]|uniref:hypothetical protein n=1 Tax=Streptomyces sp. NBC_01716 TaxID=2975917 RepID=UPI002E368BC2|nr:hypothetical protein [Streptomyces sp. NBC_01716]